MALGLLLIRIWVTGTVHDIMFRTRNALDKCNALHYRSVLFNLMHCEPSGIMSKIVLVLILIVLNLVLVLIKIE